MTRILCFLFVLINATLSAYTQPCNDWLRVPGSSWAESQEIDVSGNMITVEATFNRTTPYTGGYLWAGDLVSKHLDPSNANYLLRPNSAEITTSNGYFVTPGICEIQLNKTYHVAMTYDGTTLRFYRNGFLMSQVAATGMLYQNNFKTRIGFYEAMLHPESFIGYIDEVRIWNVVRTQAEIRNYMNTSLPNPATQAGLLAYYTFEDLANKQGNNAFDLTLSPNAAINQTNTNCPLVADSCVIPVIIPDFTAPDTVCVNSPVSFTNTTSGASTYYWNFCVADINKAPTGVNLGNPSSALSWPVFMDYVQVNGNYYGFVTNYDPGGLVRLDFGNSLLNTPTAVNLGDFGGVIPSDRAAEGIQIIQNEGKWYAIIVGGYLPVGSTPRVLKIEFGSSITNPSPTATDWGNIGNMDRPIDLHMFKEGDDWYGFTVNSENNTITRFSFTNSFDNTPTAVNLGNIGNLAYPTGIHVVNDNGDYKVFITNGGNGSTTSGVFSITRLDFGSSLLNTPTGTNLGNPNNIFQHPRDLTILKSCGQIVGFAVNGHPAYRDIVKFDFHNDLSSVPTGSTLGNIGNLGFPHSISKMFRVNDDVYAFVTNVNNNTITRLQFSGCSNSSIPSSTAFNPPAITYDQPGVYNINLTIDDGLATQASVCKQVVVLPNADFEFKQDVCNPLSVDFTASVGSASNLNWLFHDGTTDNQNNAGKTYNAYGDYEVELSYDLACAVKKTVPVKLAYSNIIATQDTTICDGSPKQLRTTPSVRFCWTPTTHLDDPLSPNPITSTPTNITYYFTAEIPGTDIIQRDSVVIKVENPSLQVDNDTLICSMQPVQLNASGAATYSWSPATGLSNANIANPLATPANTTTYTVTGVTANGCTAQNSLIITTKPNPIVSITSDTIVCKDAPTQLYAGGGAVYQWSPAAGLTNANIPDPIVTASHETTYKVLVTGSNACTAEDSVKISIKPYPVFSASESKIVCEGTQVQFAASGGDNYTWSPAPAVSNANISNPVTTPLTTTNYQVHISENACGHDTTINRSIVVNPVPRLTVQKSNDADCNVPTANLSVTGALNYVWSPAIWLDDATSATPVAAIDSTTTFAVMGINEFGCSSTEFITVKADGNKGVPRFVVPNAFTPNGDGKNDCFGIQRWGNAKIAQFAVYNRWGQMVFESSNPRACWDGTFKGIKQDAGGYVYIIRATTLCGVVTRKGILTLIR